MWLLPLQTDVLISYNSALKSVNHCDFCWWLSHSFSWPMR